ncbi:MAG: type II secretion system protein GspD [Candidatus Riflebacteria bacterium]|nr:type II secretion system protein GspD [Candidatus Riflebacteria bacterium]
MNKLKYATLARYIKRCFFLALCGFMTIAVYSQEAVNVGLTLQDTPLEVALRLVAEQAGKKLEVHTPLNEIINVNIQNASPETAFNSILEGKPYMWAVENDVVHIFKGSVNTPAVSDPVVTLPMEMAAPEKTIITRILPLKNRKAQSILDLVSRMAGRDSNIVADPPTNSLIMVGEESAIENVASLASNIDATPVAFEVASPEEIVSESFSLEYVIEFGDLEKNLSMILYGEEKTDEAAVLKENYMNTPLQNVLPSIKSKPPVQNIGGKKEFYMLDKTRRVLLITATRSKMGMIRQYFNLINTPIPQVLIEAHIVALEEGTDRNLGITWNMQEKWGAIYSDGQLGGATRQTGTQQGQNGVAQIGGGFLFGRLDLSNVTAVLQAIQDQNRGQILSQPRLMTLSGKVATIDISTKYPYKSSVTQNQVGTTQNVAFVDVGIVLNVLPQINKNAGTVVMQLDPNVSDLVSISSDGPVTTQRRTSTNVEVKNGETVVIGGLLRDEDVRLNKTVPFLSKIPILGEFFNYSQKKKKRTNLMILITPKFITDKYPTLSMPAADSAKLASSSLALSSILPQTKVKLPANPQQENKKTAVSENSKIQAQTDYQKRLEKLQEKYLR